MDFFKKECVKRLNCIHKPRFKKMLHLFSNAHINPS